MPISLAASLAKRGRKNNGTTAPRKMKKSEAEGSMQVKVTWKKLFFVAMIICAGLAVEVVRLNFSHRQLEAKLESTVTPLESNIIIAIVILVAFICCVLLSLILLRMDSADTPSETTPEPKDSNIAPQGSEDLSKSFPMSVSSKGDTRCSACKALNRT